MRKPAIERLPNGGLGDITVAVTRPPPHVYRLSQLLAEHGAQCLPIPVIDIAPTPCTQQTFDSAATADLAIFISPNAASHAVACVQRYGEWPKALPCFAVGAATGAMLKSLGITVAGIPDKANTQGLLSLDAFSEKAVKARHVVIFRGVGGLPTLGASLEERGAYVTYCEVYRRQATKTPPISANLRGMRGEIDIIAVTSEEILRCLVALIDPLEGDWLRRTPLVVASERIAKSAAKLGWRAKIVIAPGAGDGEMLAALLGWGKERKEQTE